VVLGIVLAPVLLSGCAVPSFGAHPSATVTGRQTYHLWQGFTIGAIVVGGITLGLILWAAIRYKVRDADAAVPRQTQYHLPLEVTYTVIPILIVLVLFAFTVVVENNVTADPAVPPNNSIRVEAFQWGWNFFYPGFVVTGQTTQRPTIEMPVGEDVRITLVSRDVVHGFYVRDFNFSRYALPGVTNVFTFNATQTGTFFGQCTQLCGLYHSIMWFQVKVVTPTQYVAWLHQNQTAAARLAAIAAAASSLSQGGAGIAVRPDVGGGTN
jgi:cytochrome c oxidase subunit II